MTSDLARVPRPLLLALEDTLQALDELKPRLRRYGVSLPCDLTAVQADIDDLLAQVDPLVSAVPLVIPADYVPE